MELDNYTKLKKIAIMAMFSDDFLLDNLVLKGGNALDIVYGIANRASLDVDFSMEGEFAESDLPTIERRIEATLTQTFRENGYHIFDFKFAQRPTKRRPDQDRCWGGYKVEFKVIELELAEKIDIEAQRRQALVLGPRQHRVLSIDISKFEYCKTVNTRELDGLTLYVYTPELIVIEKLRAICQQMPEYSNQMRISSASPRARDFFDIYTTVEAFNIDIASEDNHALIRSVFEAKRVPLSLLLKVTDWEDFHQQDFFSVQSTVVPGTELKPFSFYFEYVVALCMRLEACGIV